MSFDWQTEDEGAWEPEAEPPRPPAGPNRRRTVLLALLLLAVAGATFSYFYREAARRIAATEEAVTGDILSSHELVAMAGRSGDPELLRTVLSGADSDWARAQAERVENGAQATHAYFGLQPLDDGQPAVILDPEMRAAELSWPARFAVTDSLGLTSTIVLTQTAVYRRGSQSWLLAPPRPDFWGGSGQYRGGYLEAIFSERDESIARRLAADLDSFLVGLCTSRSCPAGYHLRLIFSTDPASFEALDPTSLRSSRRTLSLPTPTLVGLPLDHAAYEAVQRGYALLVSDAVLADLADYGCCRGELYGTAWIRLQQHQLGLRQWPLDARAYEQIFLALPTGEELTGLLRADVPDPRRLPFQRWAPVFAFAQFLEEEYHPAVAQAAVNTSYGRILRQSGVSIQAMNRAWARFLYEKSRFDQPAPELPVASLLLSCSGQSGRFVLRELDLQKGGTRTVYEDLEPPDSLSFNFSYAEPLGAGNDLLIISRHATLSGSGEITGAFTLEVASQGITTTLLTRHAPRWDELPNYYPSGRDPRGRYLVLGDYSYDGSGSQATSRYHLLDLRGCDGDSCPLTPLTGYVRWSPDGAATLVVSDGEQWPGQQRRPPRLYAGDEAAGALRAIDIAHVSAWLDNERYAYVTFGSVISELVVRALPDHEELLRVPLTALWARAGEPGPLLPNGASLDGRMLLPNPRDPLQLLVDASWTREGYAGESSLFVVTFSPGWSGVTSSRYVGTNVGAATFSPTGRWLARDDNDPRSTIELIDLSLAPDDPGATRALPRYLQGLTWAPGGDWLALNGGSFVLLHNPSAGAYHFVPVEESGCYLHGWHQR